MKLKEIKKRYCECGRELGYHRKLCDDCRDSNKRHYQIIAEHNRIERNPTYYRDLMRERRKKTGGEI